MKTTKRRFSSPISLSCALMLVALCLSRPDAVVGQWTTPTPPDTNISNTNTGNVGVGTPSPGYKLEVATSTDKPQIRFGLGQGDSGGYLYSNGFAHATLSAGTSWNGGWIAKSMSASFLEFNMGETRFYGNGGLSTGSAYTPTERMRITAYGNVGIGTATPLNLLTVSGSDSSTTAGNSAALRLVNTNATINNTTAIKFSTPDSAGAIVSSGMIGTINTNRTSGSAAGDLFFSTANLGSATEKMRITGGGNVGIGTGSPGGLLNLVKNQATGTELRINNSDAAGLLGLYLNGGFAQPLGGFVQYNNTTGGKNLFVSTGGADPLYLGTDGTPRLTVLPTSGNVGIGTVAPTTRLDVAGQIRSSTGGYKFPDGTVQTTAAMGGASQWSNSSNNIFFNTGTVGIGAASPAAPLFVTGNEPSIDYATLRVKPTVTHGGIVIDSANNTSQAHLRFFKSGVPKWQFRVPFQDGVEDFRLYSWTSASDVLSITPSGKVGIGLNAPLYSLDVNGGTNGFRAKATTISSGDAIAVFENSSGIQAIVRGNGNIGIGATAPAVKLAIGGNGANITFTDAWIENNLHVQGNETLAQGGRARMRVGTAWGYAGLYAETSSTSVANDLVLGSGSGKVRVGPGGAIVQSFVVPNGNVGIGTGAVTPSEKLEVVGNISVTGTGNITALGTITGGTINAKYQDVAEWVQSSQILSAGTVVVLDHTQSNQVVASSRAYDTSVAGVISLQPGIALGERGAGKVLVATTGRVKIKVDATSGPIRIGDLLVTSDKVGVARKSEPLSLGGVAIHRPGTLIGKALEPLAGGTGEILVLLSLQ
ncbi:MAG TPA: hypothetical protein VNO50_20435 [Pyrinomonadaceae bacterium]|nr:hypothetical protein [Pyrinomonadaceae bacterium]